MAAAQTVASTARRTPLGLASGDVWAIEGGAVWVAVEMGGVPLQDFVHPPRAVYVLGSEDNGLNRPIVEACQCHVALPKWVGRSASYNVAMAGTLVMYDRMQKQHRDGHVVTREGRGGDEDR